MKVVILAGGLGTRIAEETETKPKPMVEIGGRPILWHIMKHYAHYAQQEFVLALGYKSEVIKRFFLDYSTLSRSMTIDLATGIVEPQQQEVARWLIHMVDTGVGSNTGGRVLRLRDRLRDTFLLTYGDGVSDVDVEALVRFHKSHGKCATVTAVRPPARFGELVFDGDMVRAFTEKPQTGEGWINGGFMVLEPRVFDLFDKGDDTSLEADVLEALARRGELAAYRHPGFWQCMDTLRDKRQLEAMWERGTAPWKTWG